MEEQRQAALQELQILDTEPEAEFDEIVRLAASICSVPISAITLLDDSRQWFKAKVGVTLIETSRRLAFCDHTIRQDDLMVIEDALADERFANHPAVTAASGVRFYAGIPVNARDGHKVGTLCVIDNRPRQLSQEQRNTLTVLAHQVSARFELRLQRLAAHDLIQQKTSLIKQLEASDTLFRMFMHHSPLATFVKNQAGEFVYCNRRMAESAGIGEEDCLGKTDAQLWPESIAEALTRNDTRALSLGHVVEAKETTAREGQITEWRTFKFPWRSAGGEQMLAGIAIDITGEHQQTLELQHYQLQLEEANSRLLQTSMTDSLTNLPNRRALSDRMKALASSGWEIHEGKENCVLMLDVDHFKQLNDTFGHAYGDLVLKRIADILSRSMRVLDLAARYGGEEFAVLMPSAGLPGGIRLARCVQRDLRRQAWEHYPVTISIGIATQHPGDHGLIPALSRSDRALYAAKQTGRNRIMVVEEPGSLSTPVRESGVGRKKKITQAKNPSRPFVPDGPFRLPLAV